MRISVFSWGPALAAGLVLAAVCTGAGPTGTATAASSAAGGTVPSGIVIVCAQDTSGDTNDTCTATVGGGDGVTAGDGTSGSSPAVPTGTVTFALDPGAAGGFPSGASCTLAPTSTDTDNDTSSCAVVYAPGVADGTQLTMTAAYPGDAYFAPSNGSPTAAVGAGYYATTGWTPAAGTEGGEAGTSTLPEFDLTGLATGANDSITTMDMTSGVYSGTADVSGVQFADNGVENGDFTVLQLTEGGYVSTNAVQYFLLPNGELAGTGRWYGGNYVGLYPDPSGRAAVSETITCLPASGSSYTCSESVTGTADTPAGNATFSDSAGGSFSPSNACVLSGGTCSVTYTPPAGGDVSGVSGVYSGSPTDDWAQAAITSGMTSSTTTATTGGPNPTSVQVVCNDMMPGQAGDYDQCTATVGGTDSANPSAVPTGSVTFTVNRGETGGFPQGATCTLAPSQDGGGTSFCSVNYSPPAALGTEPPITATYSGDTNFASSSGSPALGGGIDTGTDATPSPTTTTQSAPAPTTTTTDTTPDSCQATTSLRVAHTPAACPSAQMQALLQKIQDLDTHIAQISGELAAAEFSHDSAETGVGAAGVEACVPGGQPVATATAASCGAVLLATDLATKSLTTELNQATAQRDALQAQLDALIKTAKAGQRVGRVTAETLATVAKPMAIKLTLPAGIGTLAAVLKDEAAVIEYQRVAQTTLTRIKEAAAARLSADVSKQWAALAGYDQTQAGAVKRLDSAEAAFTTALESSLRRHHASPKQARAALAAIEHPSAQLVKDARLLGAGAVLTTSERQARKVSVAKLKPAAIIAALARGQAAQHTAVTGLASHLGSLATQAQQFAALVLEV
jgi:hypothetical protein